MRKTLNEMLDSERAELDKWDSARRDFTKSLSALKSVKGSEGRPLYNCVKLHALSISDRMSRLGAKVTREDLDEFADELYRLQHEEAAGDKEALKAISRLNDAYDALRELLDERREKLRREKRK